MKTDDMKTDDMKTVLVTGGAGFIGSHLVEELLRQRYTVIVLDDLSQGERSWVPAGAQFVQGSITDAALCERLCAQVDGVFHLAAMSRVAASISESFGPDAIEKFRFCTEQNILGTQTLLLAARATGVKRFVYASSSAIYGDGPAPNRVTAIPRCLNPYSFSKYAGEEMCGLFARHYGLSTISLRFFNVYGPRQPTSGPYALVLGIFLRQWKSGQALTIHGDGLQSRDFIHIRDIVSAMLAAHASSASDVVLNVGSGETYSIKQLADLISNKQVFEPRRAADAQVTLADIEETKRVLHWELKVSFRQGIEEMKALAMRDEL